MYYLILWHPYELGRAPKWVTVLSGTVEECATAINQDFPDLINSMRVVTPNERLQMQ